MLVCFGKKACNRARCKAKCKAYFPDQPGLQKGCRKACYADPNLDKDTYLCSGNWISQEAVMGAYHYDPCLGDAITTESYLDPLNDRAREEQRFQDLQPIFLGLGLLIAAALTILYFTTR